MNEQQEGLLDTYQKTLYEEANKRDNVTRLEIALAEKENEKLIVVYKEDPKIAEWKARALVAEVLSRDGQYQNERYYLMARKLDLEECIATRKSYDARISMEKAYLYSQCRIG